MALTNNFSTQIVMSSGAGSQAGDAALRRVTDEHCEQRRQ
jgi:hypothetical protein